MMNSGILRVNVALELQNQEGRGVLLVSGAERNPPLDKGPQHLPQAIPHCQ